MKTTFVALAALTAAAPGFAQTPDTKANLDRAFAAMDADKDGQIARAEFDGFMQARYARQAEGIETAFVTMDKNKDGKLSKEEAAAVPVIASAFDALDADKDGSLSKSEMHAALAKSQAAQTEVE